MAATASIPRGSDRDGGAAFVVVAMLVVVVLRDARRAYKLHTIALTPFSYKPATPPPTCPTKIALRPLQLIYLIPLPVLLEKRRDRARILGNEKTSMKNVHASVSITEQRQRK